jgi:hypothetical protein
VSEVWTEEDIERKFAPLLKWRDSNENDEAAADSIGMIELCYGRMKRTTDPAAQTRIWRQMVDEGDAANHKDWPIGRGPTSKLPACIKAEADRARAKGEAAAAWAIEDDPRVKNRHPKRPRKAEPQLMTDEAFIKAAGQTEYNATTKLFDAKLLTAVNDDEGVAHATYKPLSLYGYSDEEE